MKKKSSDPVPKPRGQPTLYKPEYCDAVIEHMGRGLSFESYAPKAGVHRDTLYEWAKVHPNFSDAKKKGEGLALLYMEELMLSNIPNPASTWSPTPLMFMMKCRFPTIYNDQPKPPEDTSQAPVHVLAQRMIDMIKDRK